MNTSDLLGEFEAKAAAASGHEDDGSHIFPYLVKGAPYEGCSDCWARELLGPLRAKHLRPLAEAVKALRLEPNNIRTASQADEALAALHKDLEAGLRESASGGMEVGSGRCSCYRMAEVSAAEWAARQPCGPVCTVLKEVRDG